MVREYPNLEYGNFVRGVQAIDLSVGSKAILDLRDQVVNNPNLLADSDNVWIGGIPNKKWDLITFVVTWKMLKPDWISVFIETEVSKRIRKLDFEDQVFIRTLMSLETEEQVTKFLYWTPYLGSRKLFGLVLNQDRIKAIWSKLEFRSSTPSDRVKIPQRKRGYDDKGSKRPDHLWLPTDGLYFDTLSQLIEFETKAIQARVDFNLTFTRTLEVS